MILVDGQNLRFLLAGRTLTLEVHREYRKGRDYAVGKTVRKATCRARIEEIERTGKKTWRIVIRHLVHERPRLLARASQYGYVEVDALNPGPDMHRASFDEPEPVDSRMVARWADRSADRDDAERRRRAREERQRAREHVAVAIRKAA